MNQKVKIGLAVITGFIVGLTVSKVFIKNTKVEQSDQALSKQDDEEPVLEKELEMKEDVFPLKLGSKGEKVKRLQIFLMRQLGWVRQPNGEFDSLTKERTLKYFKQDHISEELFEKLMLDKMVHDQRKKRA